MKVPHLAGISVHVCIAATLAGPSAYAAVQPCRSAADCTMCDGCCGEVVYRRGAPLAAKCLPTAARGSARR